MDKKDVRTPVVFGGPHVDPGVSDPQALNYARSIQQRRAGVLPKYTAPVAGGPTPPIPRLDGPYQPGVPMAAQAGSIMEQPGTPPAYGLTPSDMLPPEAQQDPAFIEGQGAMFAVAQPGLAFKYGVIRQGQRIPAQQLRPGPRRSPVDTAKDLKAIDDVLKAQKRAETGETAAEQASAHGAAGAAARVANVVGDDAVTPLGTEEKEKLERAKEAVSRMDDLDFNEFRSALMKDLLNNDDQRKIIEERIAPMDLSDLITKGFVTQTVPIVAGTFEPTFRSMSGEEDLALKRLIMEESKNIANVSDRYLLDKYSMMSIAVGLYALGKTPIPTPLDEQGNFSDKLFWAKFNKVLKLPFHMLASLGVNFFWFDVRVRKLFVAEKIKNG